MAHPVPSARWHGWLPVGAPPAPHGAGPWLELSHVLRSDLSRVSAFPAARFERLYEVPRDPMNSTTMSMVCHYGTHVDAPCHFIPGAPAFHEIPLDRLCGSGVVWRLHWRPGDMITGDQVARGDPTSGKR